MATPVKKLLLTRLEKHMASKNAALAVSSVELAMACTHKSSGRVRFRAKRTLEPTSPNDRV
jgi:hypothetical protein